MVISEPLGMTFVDTTINVNSPSSNVCLTYKKKLFTSNFKLFSKVKHAFNIGFS